MSDTLWRHSRNDGALLRNIIVRRTALAHLAAVAAILLVAMAWYRAFGRILAFGLGLDLAQLNPGGPQVTELLQRYNPYFWQILAWLLTLLLAYLLWIFMRAVRLHARNRYVDQASFDLLANSLSPPALDVLLWAWQQRDEPLRVADLQFARTELRAGRDTLLQQARSQLATLQQARTSVSRPADDEDSLPKP